MVENFLALKMRSSVRQRTFRESGNLGDLLRHTSAGMTRQHHSAAVVLERRCTSQHWPGGGDAKATLACSAWGLQLDDEQWAMTDTPPYRFRSCPRPHHRCGRVHCALGGTAPWLGGAALCPDSPRFERQLCLAHD